MLFHGISESEFDDKDDVKVQVIKAIAKTMPGKDEEEKKKNAGKTSIEYVERIGRYNPLRSRTVKVKFTDKSDVDTFIKKQKESAQRSVPQQRIQQSNREGTKVS